MSTFKLGNFAIKEVIYGVAQNFEGDILYTLDQLQNAEVSIESDSTTITDKNGNTIKTIYKSKTGSFSATSALLSPAILNAGSGSDTIEASDVAPIQMPRIVVAPAGAKVDISDIALGEVPHVIGVYSNGANEKIDQNTVVGLTSGTEITLPVAITDGPTQYLVKYERKVESGIALVNRSSDVPKEVRMTLYVAIVDPCSDTCKAGYLYLPSLQPDPAMTISLDSENQSVDYKGTLNQDYCSCDKALYYIYLPDEDAVISTECIEGTVSA